MIQEKNDTYLFLSYMSSSLYEFLSKSYGEAINEFYETIIFIFVKGKYQQNYDILFIRLSL